MTLLVWFFRILLLLFVLRMLLRLMFPGQPRRTRGNAGAGPTPRRGAQERLGGALVRDPQCGTHVAQTSAVMALITGNTVYFCSTKCRDAYLASHAGSRTA